MEGSSATKVRRADSFNARRARFGARHIAAVVAVAATAYLLSTGDVDFVAGTEVRPLRCERILCRAVKLKISLAPPDIGQPEVPELPKLTEPEPELERSPPAVPALEPLPPQLQRTHAKAAQKVLKGLRLNLQRLSAILPMGLGDGALGASIVKELFRTTKMRPFRALVLMPEVMLEEAEARYKAVAGGGLLVMRLEASDSGTDKVVKALTSSIGLVVVGSYADAIYFVRGFRRARSQLMNLLVCEMAHVALTDDEDAYKVVMEWEKTYRVQVLQSLFISGQSLEADPVQGLEEATMEVPGVPSYKVVARRGGPGGPEVFAVHLEQAQKSGLTVPLKLVVLQANSKGLIEGLAALHQSLGVEIVKAIPESAGGGKEEAVDVLNQEVQNRTQGQCKVLVGTAVPDAILVVGNQPDPMFLLQAVGQLAFKVRQKKAAYIVILGGSGPAPTAAWQAMSAHDPRLKLAMQKAAVDRAKRGQSLGWEDLPSLLQDMLVDGFGPEKVSKNWLLKAVDEAILNAADSWDLMYGHFLAFRETMEDPTKPVPLGAEIHGVEVGKWVARQFLAWRSGTLSPNRRELLTQGGLDVEEKDSQSFAQGLAEFEQHVQDRHGNPYVPPAYFTPSGFPLAAWCIKQRADWRRGLLSVERQYMLDAVGFSPVAHPDDVAVREETRAVEAILRSGQLFPQKRRNRIFADLLKRYHPDSMARLVRRTNKAALDQVVQFLAGYRDWFLNPPRPPAKVEEIDSKLIGFDMD